MRTIKCKYCGKRYASPSEMRKRKCHSHPRGAWGGFCAPDRIDELLWEREANLEEMRESHRQLEENERNSERYKCEYKKHTPLIDFGNTWSAEEPQSYDLQIRFSDLDGFARDLANGINDRTRDAINTIYALRDGCDYVLNNTDAQEEGSLGTWLDEIRQLKDEVTSWDFWVGLYWLTKPIRDKVDAAKKDFKTDRTWNNWILDSIAKNFHIRLVIPMLNATGKGGDEKDKEVMKTVTSYVRELKSKEKGFKRNLKTLSKRINDYSFWGVLYCLYWIELRPTPWNDQKVWPIQVAQNKAEEQDDSGKHRATNSDKSSGSGEQPSNRKDDSNRFEELENLIGLEPVKNEVRKLVELVKFNAARKAKGLSAGGMTSHFVFTGNPGTGKTTVARIIAGIYRQLGILKKGHLVEVDRSKLVAGYVGHTAIQTNEVVDSAMDGVLFIDEAYSLVSGGSSDFGSEAIATLLKRMEDARERIVVIVAGYANEMSRFVKSNPGLESRFTKFIDFPDYTVDELVSIFDSIVKKNQFTCSSKGQELARKTIEAAAVNGHVSGNARYVRNLFNAVRERMARRVMKIENASIIQLQTIEAEDFGELAEGTVQQPIQPPAVSSVKSEPEQPVVSEAFNKSDYLKQMRWHTLGMRCDGGHPWRAVLGDNAVITSYQARVQSNLQCQLRRGTLDGIFVDKEGYIHENYLCTFSFHIFHDGKTFQLKIWGEFWGNTPTKRFGIDFNSEAVKADTATVLDAVREAWACFGVKGYSGCNLGNQIGSGDIWWNATIPFKDLAELVSPDFSQHLRGALAAVANAFATLLKYRVSINP